MQIIKSIFSLKDEFENNLKFLTLIGPFLLILTMALAPFKLISFISIGLLLLYKFKFKGFLLSLISLVSYSIYNHLVDIENHLYQAGIEISILLGFFITYLSFEEINKFISKFNENQFEEIENLKLRLNSKEKNFENHQTILKENFDKIEFDLKQNLSH